MSLINSRHDFINNSLRIEILNKMICESLEKNQEPKQEFLDDLEKFLKDHLEFLNKKE